MSALEDLTAAVKENTAIQKEVLATLKGGKASAAPAATAGGTGKPKPTGVKAPTLETIQTRFGAYLGVADKDEKATRKANVKSMVEHYEVAKISDVPKELYPAVLADLDAYEADGQPDWAEGGDAEEAMI